MDQQNKLYQSQRALPETSSTSLDSTAQTGHATGGDWQEEVFQKIKLMKEMYLTELSEIYQKIATKLQRDLVVLFQRINQFNISSLESLCLKTPFFPKFPTSAIFLSSPKFFCFELPGLSISIKKRLLGSLDLMDTNNWRPPQVGEAPMDAGDWRSQLQPDSRQRIVNKIMDTLKRHLPFSGHEGLQELKKIAVRFEEKIYTAATSQSDYLRKISLKMLTMETKSQNTMANSLQSNSAGNSNRPHDPGKNNYGNCAPISCTYTTFSYSVNYYFLLPAYMLYEMEGGVFWYANPSPQSRAIALYAVAS
ncbi:unnamed protein product [Prunus armeniaca]|uniref:Mediator complex subunit 15 KIX domain-containing protein n=1 Tax=Prunus armeniaca TaxID=36596 RepID=A0A6J5V7J7_PRUAR|nr:unnamed protein product [Prunus armeniaca]CAB4312175.1 unnamed protein product [Prunus armeniaca]